jgi:hypothetical protein
MGVKKTSLIHHLHRPRQGDGARSSGRFLCFLGSVNLGEPDGPGQPWPRGLAVDDGTALTVENDGNAQVYGKKYVYFASTGFDKSVAIDPETRQPSVSDVFIKWWDAGSAFNLADAWDHDTTGGRFGVFNVGDGVVSLASGNWPFSQ